MTGRSWIELSQAHTEERIKTNPGSITLHQCAQAACTTRTLSVKHTTIYQNQNQNISCSLHLYHHVVWYDKKCVTKRKNILIVKFLFDALNSFALIIIVFHSPNNTKILIHKAGIAYGICHDLTQLQSRPISAHIQAHQVNNINLALGFRQYMQCDLTPY